MSWNLTQAAAANDSIYCGRYATGGTYYRFCTD
jgi:hypothetical protein